MKLLLFILTCMFLMSCGQHRDGTSVWAEGLWVIPAVEIVGIVIFSVIAVKRRNFMWYAIGLLLALIATVWAVNADKG